MSHQIPESVLSSPPNSKAPSADSALKFTYVENPFSFAVSRTGPNSDSVLFNTSGAQLIFESQYVRLRTQIPDDANLYGFGEHSDSFRLNTTNYTRTFWNSESAIHPASFQFQLALTPCISTTCTAAATEFSCAIRTG